MNVKSIAEAVFSHIPGTVRLLGSAEMAAGGLQIVRGQSCVTRPMYFSESVHWHIYPIALANPNDKSGSFGRNSYAGLGVMYSGHGIPVKRDYPVPFDVILIQDSEVGFEYPSEALERAEEIADKVGEIGDMLMDVRRGAAIMKSLLDAGFKGCTIDDGVGDRKADLVPVPHWVLSHLVHYADLGLQSECDQIGMAGHTPSEQRAEEIEALNIATSLVGSC